jgi:hypothetical protein
VVHPIERLRYVARAGDVDPGELAIEAAGALAGLARDPRALVVSARRLIEFHPRCAPLWWVAARVLAADDPRTEAEACIDELRGDLTAEELAGALGAGATVVAAPSGLLLDAFDLRPDIVVRLVGEPGVLRWASRLLDSVAGLECYGSEEQRDALDGASLVVVEVDAAGPEGVVSAAGPLVAAAADLGVPVWAVAPVGRVLPPVLFAALAARAPASAFIPAGHLSVVVGPDGPDEATPGLRRPGCPPLAELAH